IYAISNKFSTLYMGIYNVFGLSFTESASKHIGDKDKDEYFSSVINKAIIYFAQIIIGMMLVLPLIYNILVNEKYIESYVYVPILLLASLFHVILSLYGSIYITNKKTKQIMKTSIYAAIINIIINVLFIKYIGLFAASLSTLLAYFFMTIYRYKDVKKYTIIKYDIKNLLLNTLLMIIVIISYYFNIFSLNIIIFLLALFTIIILDLKDIKSIYKYLKNTIKCRFDKK
ncbi:MAG TPA: polysaccharide biosynthesis C-terminal domain-containing protein, partial [Bacilli bacterium]|nr:polysaccharide biosynthesis C-terminal domain-containing protein [Bacilli bacterium]